MTGMPPRKRDWRKGNVQIGLFIRFETGGVIEITWNAADEATRERAIALLHEGSAWRGEGKKRT